MRKSGRCASKRRKPLSDVSNGEKITKGGKQEADQETGNDLHDRPVVAREVPSKLVSDIYECASNGRKPLSDVSTGEKIAKAGKQEADQETGNDLHDRLVVAREDLTKLVNEIDELFSQASEGKPRKVNQTQEIEAFINHLSNMRSSLKSWVPKLREALKSQPVDQLESTVDQNPDPIVSSSPLVSWRNGFCTVESGRQLFLLTPLHKLRPSVPKWSAQKSTLKSILKSTEKPKSRRKISPLKTCALLGSSSLSKCNWDVDQFGTCGDDKKSTLKSMEESTEKSTLRSTLRMKISPLKTCALLGSSPVSGIDPNGSHEDGKKSTAVDFGDDCLGSMPASSEGEEEMMKNLTLKYPELFGLSLPPNRGLKKEIDETLDWFLSPPKTCVLLEPVDDKMGLLSSVKPEVKGSKQCELDIATPAWGSVRSTVKGKKVGETTLKRELWTKFDAVSTKPLDFDRSVFHRIPRNKFLDMLEEVS